MADIIQIRRDTAANWLSVNPILAQGELGVETDTEKMKIGDGISTWTALGYFITTQGSVDITGGTIDGTVIGGSSAAAGSFTTISASGEIAANGGIALGDNDKATFGASDDLQIYHDGSNSFIKDSGTGILFIQGSGGVRVLGADTSEALARFNENSSVQLYYDNSEKFSTTSTGIDVTGTVTADGLSILSNTTGNAAFLYNSDSSANGTVLKLRSGNVGGTTDVLSIFDGNNNEQARFTASGRLGIGTSSPSEALTVSGNIQIEDNDGYLQFKDSNAGTDNKFRRIYNSAQDLFISRRNDDGTLEANDLVIDSSGNVGIGTSSPNQALSVESSSVGVTRVGITNTGNAAAGAGVQFITKNGATQVSNATLRTDNAGNFSIFTGTTSETERMRIDSSGNVGIGGSPVAGLHIQTSTRSLSLAPSATGGGGASYILMGNSDSSGVTGPNVIASGNRNLQFGVGDDFSSATGGTFSEYMRIDSSGNLLVGKTAFDSTTVGASLRPTGAAVLVSDGNDALLVNRKTSDGSIIDIRKDGTTVGSIGSYAGGYSYYSSVGAGYLALSGTATLAWESDKVYPNTDTALDLGSSLRRFKDLYLSGTAKASNVQEGVYNLTGTAIDPTNGAIQYKTLAANTTFTESLADGDSVVLRISGGATYTVTWPTMTWVSSAGNSAPTLGGSDVVVLWQESSVVYGAYVGSYA